MNHTKVSGIWIADHTKVSRVGRSIVSQGLSRVLHTLKPHKGAGVAHHEFALRREMRKIIHSVVYDKHFLPLHLPYLFWQASAPVSSGRYSKCMVSWWYQRPPQIQPCRSNTCTNFSGNALR